MNRNIKDNLIKTVKYLIIPILLVSMLIISQKAIEHSEKYYSSIMYSYYRTEVEDFPVKSWNSISKNLNNISETEYNAATSWILFDTDVINTNLFKEIASEGATYYYDFTVNGFCGAIFQMFYFIFSRRFWTFSLGSVLLVILITLSIKNKNLYYLIEALLSLIGGSIILFYFTFRGRAVDHIWISIVLILEFIYVMLLLQIYKNIFNKHKLYKVINQFIMIICICGLCLAFKNESWHMPKFAFNSRLNNEPIELKMNYNEDDLYIWKKWHANISLTYMSIGKIPSKDFMKHNMPIGDWMYGQKYFIDYLENIDVENPAFALLTRKHTYLVDENCNDILTFLKEHYGESISAKQVDTINNIPVWEFSY